MADRLRSYRGKRDFAATPEPAGAEGAGSGGRFVVQEHHARSLHWDLRLEHDGVLVSWALPRGVPDHPDENRLAVHTEDHPLEYLDFAGRDPRRASTAPARCAIWDTRHLRGREVPRRRGDRRPSTASACRAATRCSRPHGKNWMIHRMDPPADRATSRCPSSVAPMLARSGSSRATRSATASRSSGTASARSPTATTATCALQSRNCTDFTPRYPELRELAATLGARRVVLDGEVVALDEDGRPELRAPAAAHAPRLRGRGQAPHARHAGDLHDLRPALSRRPLARCRSPTSERRELLERARAGGAGWRTPAYHRGEGSGAARGQRGPGPRGRGGQAARLPL